MAWKCYGETRKFKKRDKKGRESAEHMGVATVHKLNTNLQ
jgi:hypothetical protein